MINNCEHSERICPISKSPCPGICIYSEIMENINLGIVVFDLNNKTIVFRNKLFIEMLKNFSAIDNYEALYRFLLPKKIHDITSSEPRRPTPIHYNERILGYTAYSISERFIWIFMGDITEKTRLESIAEAVNTTSNIGYVFSGVRHEIGNPINSIKTALSVLKANIDTFSKENTLKYINRTLDDIGRVEYLLRSLKNFNMYESPKLQNLNMTLFMKRLLSLIEKDFKENGISIKHIVYSEADWGYSDPRALQQVMLNILTNAADALEGRNDPYIQITVYKIGNTVEIMIEDNGAGISEEHQKELFKPFFTTKQKGTGLGLIIARKMLANINSTINMESYENFGTITHINIPEGHADISH